MKLDQAIEILERLRDGEDPRTGEALPPESPCQSPDVVRALYTLLLAVSDDVGDAPEDEGDGVPAPLKPKKPQPSRAGRAWTDDEDGRLASGFDGGREVDELARTLERSTKAIRLRLVKLGRLSAEDAPTGRRSREPTTASAE